MIKIIFFVMMSVFLSALCMPAVTYSEQATVKVEFFANDIGRVTSNPSGIDCTSSSLIKSCSAKFDANSTVTLTAMPFAFTGNHFVGWEVLVFNPQFEDWIVEKRSTSNTLPLNLADYNGNSFYVNAVFKIERCLAGVGNGCGFFGDDSFNSFFKTYGEYGPDTDTDIVVGSILHDKCCYENPNGINCGFGDSQPKVCEEEWKKAWDNKVKGRTWKPEKPFGPYAKNQGDNFDILSSPPASLPDYLKAPDGTKLDPNPPEQSYKDSDYCKSGEFCYTDEEVNENGYGICGPRIGSLSLVAVADPPSWEAPVTVNLEANLSQKSTDDSRYSYLWTAVYADKQTSYDSAEGQKTSMTFNEEGKYIIELIVKDIKSGCFRKESKEITVEKKEEKPEPKPPNKANSWGDTHLCTFDNLAYDFQAVGEFIFIKSTLPNDSFEVQVRQIPWGSRTDVSVNQAVAMNVSGDKVGFYSGKNPVCYINGSPQALTEGDDFILPRGGVINKNGQTYTVTWQDESAVAEISQFSYGFLINVYLADSYKNQIIGLMGNLDGDPKNDISTRNGVNLGTDLKFDVLYPDYADSWRISQNESLFYYEAGKTTETYTDRNFPRTLAKVSNLSAEDRAEAEKICREAGITNPVLLENCILDVGLTGDEEFANVPSDLADPQTVIKVDESGTGSTGDGDTTGCFIAALGQSETEKFPALLCFFAVYLCIFRIICFQTVIKKG
jgi:hypothetical protein